MAATRIIPIRVNKNQYDLIKYNATSQGYKSVSEFIRTRILDRGLSGLTKLRQLQKSLDNLLLLLARERFK
jgi:uncharacterized protein (DUF1778 family)